MKIRMKEDSVRLRLTQSEVSSLHKTGLISCTVPFPNAEFTYEIRREGSDIYCSFSNNCISVSIPEIELDEWAGSDQIGIDHWIDVGSSQLRILIEKDFACLTERKHEDESDMFPNPNASC